MGFEPIRSCELRFLSSWKATLESRHHPILILKSYRRLPPLTALNRPSGSQLGSQTGLLNNRSIRWAASRFR